ncbi:glycerophosphoryl diester phosphodiesterase membrane domain-containing protein [Microbacterium fluvii]|uniref:Glycerophosphoryl diester phosphodiesterase membrane domain-containing protein n=1 Tax=Microbacterium fluvii TaxID=415215 RepID=A0ABW2HED9_9MICO|nr:glycerophosphoryl diester phosphodiesterase membrane domain-containing protein [Microbacterium fluvii]MCU4671455.1 glycerophosphoryl diester phosphodiesterase membrane domain-containing protein [Microbacterium fluvii]
MTAPPAWTPAPRPGIVPLHPLTFGTILGRSFVALRQNPRVLLGFALGVQAVSYLLMVLGIGAVAWASFSRLSTVEIGSEEYDTILAGSIAVTGVVSLALGLAAGALGTIVQGVVVTEVAHAVVAEKLRLRELWALVRPVAWRLIGYAALITAAMLVGFGLIALALIALGSVVVWAAVLLGVLAVLAVIPVMLWLTVKLLLVPAAIIMEHATIRAAIARSWRLVAGRFWPILGIVVLISMVFGAIGYAVGLPFSLLSTALTTVIAPTGDPGPSAIIAVLAATLLTEVVTLLVQAVSVVVQSTASALVYVDCRMRREGLDLDLLAYVEARDAGVRPLADPYRAHIGRQPTGRAPAPPAPWGPVPPAPPRPAAPAAPPGYHLAGAAPTAAPATATPATDSTRWTAPGAPADQTDRESPWA